MSSENKTLDPVRITLRRFMKLPIWARHRAMRRAGVLVHADAKPGDDAWAKAMSKVDGSKLWDAMGHTHPTDYENPWRRLADVNNEPAPEPRRGKDLYDRAIDAWGVDAQLAQAMEEGAEYVAAVNKFKRGRPGSRAELIDEIADVVITMTQVKRIAWITEDEVIEAVQRKSLVVEQRLAERGYRARIESALSGPPLTKLADCDAPAPGDAHTAPATPLPFTDMLLQKLAAAEALVHELRVEAMRQGVEL